MLRLRTLGLDQLEFTSGGKLIILEYPENFGANNLIAAYNPPATRAD